MPLLAFSKPRFDPHFPLVERLVVSKGLLIRFDSIQIVGKKGAVNLPTAFVGGTSGFHRAAVAGSGNRTVFYTLCLLFSMKRNQELSLRTGILVMDRIIGEVSQSIIASALPSLSERDVGMDMGVLDGLDGLDSSRGHIGSRPGWARYAI